MKLRIRAAGGGASGTMKVEVPAPCSLQCLEDAIAEALQSKGIPVPRPLRVSLNKREPIQGHASSLLSQFGICNGDLLFYFERSNAFPDATGGLNTGEGSNQSLKVSHAQQIHGEPSRVLNTGKLVSVDSSGLTLASKDAASMRRELCAAAATRRVSAVAQHSIEGKSVESGDFTSMVGKAESVLNVVDTSNDMVDEPTSSSKAVDSFSEMVDGPGTSLDVVGTSNDMQIDGENLPHDMHSDYLGAGQERLSNSIPAILQRILNAEHGSVRRPSDFLLLAVHAVMLETGFVVTNDVDEGHTLPGGWSNGGVANISYTLRDMPNGTNGVVGSVVLKSLTLGGNVIIYGTITGSGLPPRKLSMLTTKHIIGNAISHDDPISSYSDVFELWKCAKDELSLPLLTAICEMAGLPAPSSLLVIPTELKMKILECLPAVDLVKAGCSCSEIRHLSANDELWKKLFHHDFGIPSAAQQLPSFRGWKSAYAVRFLDKKIVQERRPRVERRPYIHGPGPYYGIGSRYRFPIVGGDYDIYPSFGSAPFRGGLGGTRGPFGGLHGTLRGDDLGDRW